jgi:hypothetical protein
MSDPERIQKVESGATFEVWGFRASTARLEWPRPALAVLQIVGHGHGELAAPILRRWDEGLRKSERLTLLCDFWEMPGYESSLRLALTDWSVEHRARLEPIHVLTRSRLVSMGVAVANLALGGLIKVYTLRTNYDLALQKLGVPIKPGGSR